MDIIDFKKWGYKKSDDFTGLMPKLMELLGEQYCTGGSDEVLSIFDPTAKGVDQMKVVSPQLIALSDGGDEPTPEPDPEPTPDPEPDPEPGPEPEPEPEPTVEQPDVTPNTPEQDAEEQNAIAAFSADTPYSATSVVNNITIPEELTPNKSMKVSCELQDGATITNNSTKSLIIYNTSEEPVSVSVISTNGGKVYLKGNYNDIYLNGTTLPVESGQYPNVQGTISVEDIDQNVSITVNFVGDDCGVVYLGDDTLTISDGNTADMGSPTIYAPNATVEMSGKYTDVTATVSDDTLKLKSGFHASKLTLLKGNLFVYGIDLNDFVDVLVAHDGCVIEYNTYHVSQDDNSKLFGSSPAGGKIILDTDIEVTKGRQLGTLASGKELVDFNGHSLRCGDTRAEGSNTGSILVRGSANMNYMDSVGGGKFINNHNDYLIWVANTGATVNIYSGEYEGYTHTLYAEKGTINVYGGTFKLLNADTVERDDNGNLKFLLNCLDASYASGAAKINVYGGKFYEFNPAVSYSEPNGPVSFVAEGYHVVESVEDGKKVYEVVKDKINKKKQKIN